MFDWFIRRNPEPDRKKAHEEAEEISEIARDPEYEGFSEMGEVPPTPPEGEDELTTNPPIEKPRSWWHFW